MGRKSRSNSRNYDDAVRGKLKRAILSQEGGRIHELSISGGRSQNCRRASRAVADSVLRSIGEFPLPEIEGFKQTVPNLGVTAVNAMSDEHKLFIFHSLSAIIACVTEDSGWSNP